MERQQEQLPVPGMGGGAFGNAANVDDVGHHSWTDEAHGSFFGYQNFNLTNADTATAIPDLYLPADAITALRNAFYPPDIPELEFRNGGAQQQDVFDTTPMATFFPWTWHPDRVDMPGAGGPPGEHHQRRVLQGLAAGALPLVEDASNEQSNISKKTALAILFSSGLQWWFDGYSRMFFAFPDTTVSRTSPYRCLHHECIGKTIAYSTPAALRKHQNSHIPPTWRFFVCLECPWWPIRTDFTLPKDLLRHFREKHGLGGVVVHMCEDCGVTFTRPANLTRHKQNTTPEKCRRKAKQLIMAEQKSAVSTISSVASGSTRASSSSIRSRSSVTSATSFSVHISSKQDKMDLVPVSSQPSFDIASSRGWSSC